MISIAAGSDSLYIDSQESRYHRSKHSSVIVDDVVR